MRVAVVPGLPALLPSYASLVDPVPDLRAACQQAVEWLVDGASSVTVLGDPLTPEDVARGVPVPLSERVAEALLAPFGVVVSTGSTSGGSSGGGVVSTSSTSGGTTLDVYTALAQLRRDHVALRRGGLRWVHVDDDQLVFRREHPDGSVQVAARRAPGRLYASDGRELLHVGDGLTPSFTVHEV